MPSFTLSEIFLVALLAFFILGPERLPEYAAKLAGWIRQARVMAEGAKTQLKDQLGPEYQDINWRQYDPRLYDPRKIVREALQEPLDDALAPLRDNPDASADGGGSDSAEPSDADRVGATQRGWDPGRPTPFDSDAT